MRPAVVGENRAQPPAFYRKKTNTVNDRELFSVFDQAGFANTKDLKRTGEFRSRSNGRFIYLDKDLLLNNRIRVLIEDLLPNSSISGIPEVGKKFRANCTRFPKKINQGKTPCHYGRAVEADNLAALSDFLCWFSSLS